MYGIPPLTFRFHQSKQNNFQRNDSKNGDIEDLEKVFVPRCKKNQFEQTYAKGKQLIVKDMTLSKSREKNIHNDYDNHVSKVQSIRNTVQQNQNDTTDDKVWIKFYEDDRGIFRFENRKEFLDQKMNIEKCIDQLKTKKKNMENEGTFCK